MSIVNKWLNSFGSLMTLKQDPKTGLLKGTYASTTGGTGVYDVVGWAEVDPPTSDAGQNVALSILWRSNDGGKSDPSHEVSAMAGQVLINDGNQLLDLIHVFVETKLHTTPAPGYYPDKLIFKVPVTDPSPPPRAGLAKKLNDPNPISADLSGTWMGIIQGEKIKIEFSPSIPGSTFLDGIISYPEGDSYPINGFTDIFALSSGFRFQGITFSSYIREEGKSQFISMAGYLDFSDNNIYLTQLLSQSTSYANRWYQVQLTPIELIKIGG